MVRVQLLRLHLALNDTTTGSQLFSLDDAITIKWNQTIGSADNVIEIEWGDPGLANGMSQSAGNYTVKYIDQNGVSRGNLTTIEVDQEGYIVANFSNGESKKVYKLAVADFANENGLIPQFGNVFSASKDSGVMNLKEAGIEGAGKILSGALEGSNVDMAEQLTSLITRQRQYQASSKVLNVVDKLMDTLLTRTFN